MFTNETRTRPGVRIARGGADEPAALPLSTAARRVSEGLGLPITALPGLEAEDAVYVREHTMALNELIAGGTAAPRVWKVMGRHLDGAGFDWPSRGEAPGAPASLWERGEIAAIEGEPLPGLERVWRERTAAHPVWSRAAACIRGEPDFAAVWREILGGDFDVTGRGVEYTRGMEVFQASRWFGARTLLSLLGARDGGGVFLDVLGGDGYVWRLLRAERTAAEPRLAIVSGGAWPSAEGGDMPAGVAAAVERVVAGAPGLAVLVVGEPDRAGAAVPAVLLGRGASAALALSEAELARLSTLPEVVRADPEPGAPAPAAAGDALIVTNDLSPHMFYRAGLWGLPTREDATRLTRTFHEGSVDGVLLAYGTHHVPDMFAAAREAARVVRPGGRVVMHDFFDEGPAGQWFHQIVDKRSITGHDFPHIGPVQMAAVLLRAGLRDVALHEIQDPFLFACDEEGERARELALGYIAGMYGLAAGFPDGLGEMEDAIHRILTHPEVGEVPTFGEGFVYIPRRAVVATGVRPASPDAPWGEGDLRLVRRIAALFRAAPEQTAAQAGAPDEVSRYWFAPDGRWWGVTPAEREEWLAWADALDAR